METDTTTATKTEPIQLNIDALDSSQFNSFSAKVVLLFGLVFLFAYNAPNAALVQNRPPISPVNKLCEELQYECTSFDLKTNPVFIVEASQKFLSRYVVLQTSPLDVYTTENKVIRAQIEVSAFTLVGTQLEALVVKQQKELTFDCSFSQYDSCNTEEVFTVPDILRHADYYFVIKFVNSEELKNVVNDFRVETVTKSMSYSYYIFFVKFLFVLCTVVGVAFLYVKIKELDKTFYNVEQKTIKQMLLAFLAINEPFTVHIASGTFYIASTTTNYIVVSALLIWLWFSTLHKHAGFESSVFEQSSKFAKIFAIVYAVIAWISYVALGLFIDHSPLDTFVSSQSSWFNFFKVLLYLAIIIGVGWSVLKIREVIRRRNELSEREYRFFCFSAVFFLIHFYLVARGGLYPWNADGSKLILFAGLSTLYVFTVGYLYLPTKEGLLQAGHLKKYDNPAAKAAYADLELSKESSPKKKSSAHLSGEYRTPGYENFSQQEDHGHSEAKPADGYPYEHNKDDEL